MQLSRQFLFLAAAVFTAAPLAAQIILRVPHPVRRVSYDDPDTTRRSGPRFGFVYLGAGLPDSIETHYKRVNRVISLFGWESQYQIGRNPGGPQPLTSFLIAAGGLDQGVFLPSLSWVIGMRMPNNFEFGVGPNFSPAGPGLVFTAGMSHRMGTINIPLDVALVPSSIGARLSITSGFNVSR